MRKKYSKNCKIFLFILLSGYALYYLSTYGEHRRLREAISIAILRFMRESTDGIISETEINEQCWIENIELFWYARIRKSPKLDYYLEYYSAKYPKSTIKLYQSNVLARKVTSTRIFTDALSPNFIVMENKINGEIIYEVIVTTTISMKPESATYEAAEKDTRDKAKREQSIRALREIANTGDLRAQRLLMAILARNGVFNEAEKWGQNIAKEHGAFGLTCLGELYFNIAEGVERDYEKAVSLFRKAADGGSILGMHYLAKCYLGGKGVPKDSEKAIEWLHKAAEKGHITSQVDLSQYYRHGIGVEKDTEKADEWQQKYIETWAAAREAAKKEPEQ